MLVLPRRLAGLVKAAGEESPRYAMNAVHAIEGGNDTYRLEVTDGRQLIVVRGDSMGAPCDDLQECTDRKVNALIAGADWTNGFKLAGKNDRVTLAIGESSCMFGVAGTVAKATPVNLHWPPVDQVIPRQPSMLNAKIGVGVLGKVLDVAKALGIEDVTLHLFKAKNSTQIGMIGLSGRVIEGAALYFDAVMMPLVETSK